MFLTLEKPTSVFIVCLVYNCFCTYYAIAKDPNRSKVTLFSFPEELTFNNITHE